MASESVIDLYVARLRRHLGRGPHVDALTREIADHLHDAAAALTNTGMDSAAAQQIATHRFGRPKAVARSLVREQVGPASSLTQMAGAVGILGGLACVLAFPAMTYIVVMDGPRPRAETMSVLLLGVIQMALLVLLGAVAVRSAVGLRRQVLLAVIVPIGALTVFSIGLRGAADLAGTIWAAPLLVLLLLLAELALLRPWSMRGGFGPAFTRQALSVAALLELGHWIAQAMSDTAPDGGIWFQLAITARWLTLPLLALGLLATGRRLWTERRVSRPATT